MDMYWISDELSHLTCEGNEGLNSSMLGQGLDAFISIHMKQQAPLY